MTKKPFGVRVADALQKTTVEPFLFLVMFSYNVRLITLQSLLHDRACRISLNIPPDVCDNLDNVKNDYEQIQAVTYGNNLYNAYIIISTIPALVMATFLGPWSDRYSRKYPILIAVTGVTLDTSVQAIITAFPNASPYWFLASSSLSGFSGGLVIIMSSTYSYMSDITDERSRQTRYAILEFFTILATPIGSFIGGQVFKVGGYLPVMAICPISFAVAWIWMRLYVVETKPKRFDITKKQIFQDLFRLENMKASFKTCAEPRPGNLRLQIWLLLFIGFSIRLIHMGSLAIGFPYTRRTFKWDVPRYSYTTTIFSLVNATVTLLLVPTLNKRFLVHEAAVGLIGVLSLMAKMVIMSATVHEYIIFYEGDSTLFNSIFSIAIPLLTTVGHRFQKKTCLVSDNQVLETSPFLAKLAWISGTLYACGGIAVRSRISKLVSRKELGRVFSLLAMCESLTPVLGTISMTQIYNSTVHFYPGLAYAAAAVFLIPAASIFAWMMKMPTMSFTQYQESEEAKTMKELENVTAADFGYSTLK